MRFVAGFVAFAWLGFVAWAGITEPPRSPQPQPIVPGEQARLTELMYGCEKDRIDRLGELAVANDYEAYKAFLAEQLLTGGCTVLRSGDTVQIEEISLFSDATKVRKRGTTQSWWVVTRVLVKGSTKNDRT